MKKFLLFLMFALFCIPWAAQAQTLFSENFEGGSMPTGWTTDGPGTWQIGTGDYSTSTGAGNGTYNALIKHGTTDAVTKLITPEIDLSSVTSATLNFMHIQRSWAGDVDELRVYYRTSASGTWTMLVEYTGAVASWTTEEDILLPNITATYQLAFEYTDNYGYGVGIDDIIISRFSSCEKPVDLAVNCTDANTAVVTWNGTADTYNIDVNGTITNGVSSPYTITGLTGLTTYSVKVQSDCGGGELSGWTSATFSTPAGIPLIEAFGTSLPTGWAKYSGLLSGVQAGTEELVVSSYGGWYFSTNNGVFDNHAYVNIYGTSCKYWLVTPSLTMENNVQLLFDVAYTAYSGTAAAPATDGTDDKFVVLINDGQGWSVLRQWDNAGSNYVLNNLGVIPTTVAIDLSSYAGQNIAIAFYGESTESNADNNLHIDNVSINYIPNCPVPTSLAASNVTAHTADFTWESNADSWQVCLDNDEANLNPVTTPTYTVTGLDGETQHTVKVRAICGNDFSDWTNPVTFTTLVACPVPTLAYSGAVTNLTAHSGTVNWTENGEATEWVVAYKVTSDTEADFEEITVTENPYTLENLTPETGYTVKVKAVCGGIDGESQWSATRTFTTTIACPAPTNLQCTEATTTTATLTWFEGEATQWEVCLNNDEENLYSVFDSPTITIENLAPGTTYSFKVRAICDSASAWSSSYSFTTVFAIPMVQPFDASSIPAGWNMYTGSLGTDGTANLTSVTYGWTFGTGNGVFDRHARANIYGTGCYRWLVTPYLEMEDNVRLTFDLALTAYSGTVAAPETTGTDDKFVVLITTDGGSTWEVLRQWDNAGSEYVYNNIACSAEGELVNLNLSSYAGETIAIAFYGESTVSNADNNLHIDNVTIEYIPSCEKPVALAVEYNGGTEATISWESDATSFNVDVNGTVTNNVTNPYTITGLELGTTYNVMVQANCGGDLSEWSNPVSFTTDLCMPENQCELTFVLTDSYGDGWNGNAIVVTDVLTGEVLATIANQNLDGTSGGSTETQTVTLAVCDGRQLSFSWTTGSYVSEVSYTVTDINDEVVVEGSGSGFEAFTYDVSCAITTCRKPTNFAASNEGPTSVDLSWDENGESDRWQIRYKLATDSVYSASPVNATTNPFTLTGLHAETTYTAQVKPRCDVEKWSDEITFTTTVACLAPSNIEVEATATDAAISWTGFSDSYNLKYRTPRGFNYGFEHAEAWVVDNFAPCTTYDGDQTQCYGFDGQTFTNIPFTGACIAFQNQEGNLASHSGNAFGMMVSAIPSDYPDGVTHSDDWFILPELTIAAGDVFSFWGREITTQYGDETINVGVYGSTEGTFSSLLAENVAVNSTTYTKYEYDLSEYAGQTIRLAINYVSDDIFGFMFDDIFVGNPNDDTWDYEFTGVSSPYTISDLTPETDYEVAIQGVCGEDLSEWGNATFVTPPTCQVPTNLVVENVTSTTAEVSWVSEAESFDLDLNGDVIANVTNPYTLENLDPATIYTVKVRANCGDGDYSEWSVLYAFVTDCGGAKDLPYTFGFEDVNEYYSCWSTYAEDGNENSLGISAYSAAYDGSNVFVFSSYTNYGTAYDQYLLSPELNAEGEVALEFYYRTTSGYGSETFKVGYSTDGEEFIWGEEISTNDTTWTAYNDTLPAGTKYVAIHYYSDYQYYLVVDGFHVEEVVTTVTQTTALGAGANWFSSYVEITLDDLKAALVATGNTEITIQGQTQNTIYNPNNGRWTGQLRTLDLSKMYIIKVADACEITLEGMPVDPSMHPVTIAPGVNWIAYPFNTSMTVTNAFAGFAVTNDKVQSQLQNANYNGTRWTGQLRNLEPGQGYIYNSASAETRTFTFPLGN